MPPRYSFYYHQEQAVFFDPMSEYVKLFSILNSGVWGESNEVRILWITMLAICDENGEVDACLPGLAHCAKITVDECKSALACLMAPDQYSRTKDKEGRRIEVIDRGWRILNFMKFQEAEWLNEVYRKDTAVRCSENGVRTSFVYLMRNHRNGFTKIGYSSNPSVREATLQSEEPEVTLMASWPGTRQDEKQLHRQYVEFNIRGEWFQLDSIQTDAIISAHTHQSQREETALCPKDS